MRCSSSVARDFLPLSSFEAKSGGGTPQISINITGINSPSMEVIDNDAEINAEISDVVIKDIPRSGADDE